MRGWLLAAVAALPAAQEPSPAQPLEHYRAGRYEAALQGFAAQLERDGVTAAPELRANAALAALRLLRSRDAERFVAPLVDDPIWRDEAAFVLGMAAHQHAERAVVAARLADAEPMAWALATRAIRRAEMQFREALRLRPEWPAAVRNLERVQRRRDEIERERDAAQPPDPKQEQVSEPPPAQPPEQATPDVEVVVPELAQRQLTAAELAELRERVRAQQREKVRGRQDRGAGDGARGRGW